MNLRPHPPYFRLLQRAIWEMGGTGRLAETLGVSSPTVSQWLSGVRRVPIKRCIQIEKATGGGISCELLRPDFDWATLRASALAHLSRPGSSPAAARQQPGIAEN